MKNISLVAIAFGGLVILFFTSCKKETTNSNNMKSYTTTVELAYNSSQTDPRCFLDLDSGKVYKLSEALAHQSEIDLVYVLRYSAADDPMFISLGAFDGKGGYPISYWNKTTLGIDQFSTFNHTLISIANSSNTASGFATINTVGEFTKWLDGNYPIDDFYWVDPSYIGDMYLFKTHQNKNGAFKLINSQNGSQGFATIHIKIEP